MALVVTRIMINLESGEYGAETRDTVTGRVGTTAVATASLPAGMRNNITNLATVTTNNIAAVRVARLNEQIAALQAEVNELGG